MKLENIKKLWKEEKGIVLRIMNILLWLFGWLFYTTYLNDRISDGSVTLNDITIKNILYIVCILFLFELLKYIIDVLVKEYNSSVDSYCQLVDEYHNLVELILLNDSVKDKLIAYLALKFKDEIEDEVLNVILSDNKVMQELVSNKGTEN